MPTPKTKTLFLGIDAGGTKTHAVLTNERDEIVAETRSGPGNPLSAGEDSARSSLRDAVRRVLHGIPNGDLRRAHFGVAGAGRPSDAARVERLVEELGLPCPVTVSDDAKISFYAAADPPGAVLICGTGSIAVAYEANGEEHRSGGHGYLLGDEGSGYWIGHEAIRAALRSADGRGEPTELARAVPEVLGRTSLEEVVSAVYAGGVRRPEIAALAARVLEMEDPQAATIIATAADELTLAVRATLVAARIEAASPQLVFSGGLLGEGNPLRELVENRLRREFPPARIIRGAALAPAVGAARLARMAVRVSRPGSRGP